MALRIAFRMSVIACSLLACHSIIAWDSSSLFFPGDPCPQIRKVIAYSAVNANTGYFSAFRQAPQLALADRQGFGRFRTFQQDDTVLIHVETPNIMAASLSF